MKAIRFHKTGGPEVLVYEEMPMPEPKESEVLIRVEAAGVNFADITRRRGSYYPEQTPAPYTIGAEVVGTIAALGAGVTSFEIGTLVIATPPTGGYAEYVSVPAFLVIPVPPGLSAVQATTLMAQGLTAALSIKHAARMQPGESILIEGAAGGVGSFAVQLAKLYGAGKVIAAASSLEKRKIAESLGADASVDYTEVGWAEKVKELTEGKGVDIVLELAGGETTQQALEAMAPFSRMIYLGQSSGEIPLIDPWKLTVPTRSVTGFSIFAYLAFPEMIQSTLIEIIGFVLSGKLNLQIGAVLPLSQAAEAHHLVEGRKSTGKVVLDPWA
ncbi:MAG: quinone oxidoreductase [Ferruginibacter sp.]